MKHLLLVGDETPTELREAIANLRAKQRAAVIASTRDEIAADVDELVDILVYQEATRPTTADAV